MQKKFNRYLSSLVNALLILLPACSGGGGNDEDAGGSNNDTNGGEVQNVQVSLDFGGLQRSYLLHVPASYHDGDPVPLVLALHGGGGDADSLIRSAGWNDKADQEGFIVAYPNGAGPALLGKLFGTWNAGACCGYAQANNINDVGFISAVIDDIESHFSVDSMRIFATGHSNGALMAYRLACELPNRIAAIAANAGQDAISCAPSRPIPILDVHGVLDPRVPIEGGHCGQPEPDGWDCRSVEAYNEEWRSLNGCPTNGSTLYSQGEATCTTYTPCRNNTEVASCVVGNGGHTWPGGNYELDTDLWKSLVGPLSTDLPATDVIWDFFSRHTL